MLKVLSLSAVHRKKSRREPRTRDSKHRSVQSTGRRAETQRTSPATGAPGAGQRPEQSPGEGSRRAQGPLRGWSGATESQCYQDCLVRAIQQGSMAFVPFLCSDRKELEMTSRL